VRLLAKGRAADVFDLGDGTVLRRYREDVDVAREATFMEQVRRAGYPAPAVLRAEGLELVMERVDGPTMLADLARRPWRLHAHADLLASLMKQLHLIPVVGGHALHRDLHPGNVILSPRGPVVIDWTAARIGPWAEDVAVTWLLLATSIPNGGRLARGAVAAAQGAFTHRFLHAFDLGAVREMLPELARQRLQDPHVTRAEAVRLRRLSGPS
jgi:aminoglycoside phosphotransferase (APT) family kinase protein